MTHECRIVEGSVEQTSSHGIAFTARCCGDPATDHRIHVQDVAYLSEDELRQKMEQLLSDHADLHAKAIDAVDVLRGLGADQVVGKCRQCGKNGKP